MREINVDFKPMVYIASGILKERMMYEYVLFTGLYQTDVTLLSCGSNLQNSKPPRVVHEENNHSSPLTNMIITKEKVEL